MLTFLFLIKERQDREEQRCRKDGRGVREEDKEEEAMDEEVLMNLAMVPLVKGRRAETSHDSVRRRAQEVGNHPNVGGKKTSRWSRSSRNLSWPSSISCRKGGYG